MMFNISRTCWSIDESTIIVVAVDSQSNFILFLEIGPFPISNEEAADVDGEIEDDMFLFPVSRLAEISPIFRT